MAYQLYIILALILSIFASSTNVDLWTNTNFILMLLLALGAYYYPTNTCCNRRSFVTNDFV
ncbi:MAG: hypothetical protein WCS51_00395 [Bacilli bacterium]